MKSRIYNNLYIVNSLAFVCWLIISLLCIDFDRAGFCLWFGLVAGIISFIVTIVSVARIGNKNSRNTTEINLIPIFITEGYFAFSIFCNTVLVLVDRGIGVVIPISVNLILLAIFIGVRIFTDGYTSHVEDISQQIEQQSANKQNISNYLSQLITMAYNRVIKDSLLKLKELVDYSNSASSTYAASAEKEFVTALSIISSLLDKKADVDKVVYEIGEAEKIWRRRNSL